MTDPTRVLVAGDWHGNTDWARGVIEQLPKLIPDETDRIVLHVGDFGVWPGWRGEEFLEAVEEALMGADAQLWFIDGNHEWHDELDRIQRCNPREDGRVRLQTARSAWNGERIHYLPRGHRWMWHSRTWLALGGATSVDRPVRRQGVSWWPQEALTVGDVHRAVGDGPAEVMLTHDCPAAVPLNLPPAPRWWEMDRAERHRELLATVVDEVRPSWLIHGHYHLAHESLAPFAHGDVHVTGLDQDGALRGNYRVLNVADMTWETT